MTTRPAVVVLAVALVALAGCASEPVRPSPEVAAVVAGYPTPEVPGTLAIDDASRARFDAAWQRLQAGDLRGATREFTDIVKRASGFYPAIAALGFVDLVEKDYASAVTRFDRAVSLDDAYLPAWLGLSDAAIGAGDDARAVQALERVVALDPARTEVRARLGLLRLRQVQTLVDAGRQARLDGRLDVSERNLRQALEISPSSTLILRELTETELARGDLDRAEAHARQATTADPRDAEAWHALADVLERQQRFRDALTALERAVAIDARPAWRDQAAALRERAATAALPAPLTAVASSPAVTRGEAAAYMGVRLAPELEGAPRRGVSVATDVVGHWAAEWILRLTQAGIMDVYPNHTFQPGTVLRRSDLAQITSRLLDMPGVARPAELQRWRASRPTFADLPPANLAYRAAAVALASGAMTAPGGRFEPSRAASGADLDAVVTRIIQLSR